MKTLICAISTVFILCSYQGFAQPNPHSNQSKIKKPNLFDDLPAKMNARIQDLQSLFVLPVGSNVNTLLAEGFPFKGTVVSRSKEDPSYSTIVIRSTNRQGSALTLTKSTTADGNTLYSGRIVSLKSADSFDFVQQEGQYFFVKRGLTEIIME